MTALSIETKVDILTAETFVSKSTGTNTTATIDLKGYEEVLIVLHAVSMGTGGTLAITIEESDDDSNWSTAQYPSGTNLAQSAAAITAVGNYPIRLRAQYFKRYVRLSVVIATDAVVYGVLAMPYLPQYSGTAPVVAEGTAESYQFLVP